MTFDFKHFKHFCNLNKGTELGFILKIMDKVPQDSKWHPEGSVYKHTEIVFNRARQYNDIDLLIAAAFHDMGKIDTTKKNKKGNWCAYGHEFVSLKYLNRYKNFIEEINGNFDRIYNIVKEHMRIKLLDEMKLIKRERLKNNIYFSDILLFNNLDDMSTLI